jgi:ABC-type glycerol-3-phosphate transport system permease component
MFPAIVTTIPLFLMMRDLSLLNTRTALVTVIPDSTCHCGLMMRGFFAEVVISNKLQWWTAIRLGAL